MPGPIMNPLIPRKLSLVIRLVLGLGLVGWGFWYMGQTYVKNRECEARGGIPIYGRCAQPYEAKR